MKIASVNIEESHYLYILKYFYRYCKIFVLATFMLDTGEELWLWQGWWPETESEEVTETITTNVESTAAPNYRGSSSTRLQAERRAAMQTALDYWKRKYGENDDDDPKVYLVWAGLEPLRFTNCFPEWIDRDDIAEINMKVSDGVLVLSLRSRS